MTLTIDGYVVELKVRESWQNRNSKEAALNFINHLSIVFAEAADGAIAEGGILSKTIADDYKETSRKLFDICDENGCYDNMENLT